MEQVAPDILEQILVRLEVKDLMICKRVCKSWHSFILSTRFVKTHLNISHNNDYNAIGRHRRIVMCHLFSKQRCFILVGSSNGLVCISDSLCGRQLLVVNPLTREVKQLKTQPDPCTNRCWGFGYDSSTDDYKVIVGRLKSSHQICFQMLTLKSNVWIDIGEVNNCKCIISEIGTLCTGKLHWFVRSRNDTIVILSFDLSKEEFKEEIPVPDDDDGIHNFGGYTLGVIKDRLCIYGWSRSKIWVMNNDDVKQPWKLTAYDHGMEKHVVHYLKLQHYLPNKSSFCTNIDDISLSKSARYISSPIFVQSLVSPRGFC